MPRLAPVMTATLPSSLPIAVPSLAARQFYAVSELFELRAQPLAVIALDLEHRPFARAARAAVLLQHLQQRVELALAAGQPRDGGDGLAAVPLRRALYPHDAVVG